MIADHAGWKFTLLTQKVVCRASLLCPMLMMLRSLAMIVIKLWDDGHDEGQRWYLDKILLTVKIMMMKMKWWIWIWWRCWFTWFCCLLVCLFSQSRCKQSSMRVGQDQCSWAWAAWCLFNITISNLTWCPPSWRWQRRTLWGRRRQKVCRRTWTCRLPGENNDCIIHPEKRY